MVTYRISKIEGIGPTYAAKLQQAGLKTVHDLLEKCCSAKHRRRLAADTGIDAKMLLKWVNRADLFRIKGIGQQYSDLLEKAGVDTVKELRNRSPENLHAKLAQVNASGRAHVRALPGLKAVRSWIGQAKQLEPKVTH